MRKAAIVVGIISTLFVLLAVVMKLTGFPGALLFFLVFVSLFNLVALPLNLAWQFSQNKAGMKRAADIVGMIGVWTVLYAMVYKALLWPGGLFILVMGGLLMAAFAVLFVIASKQEGVVTTWISPITVMTAVIFICLGIGWGTAQDEREFGAEHMKNYESEYVRYEQELQETDDVFFAFVNDTAISDSDRVAAQLLYDRAKNVLLSIRNSEREFVGHVNREDIPETGNPAAHLYDLRDEDMTTNYFVGPEVEMPTGKGMEIYSSLSDLRKNYLHPDISFFVPMTGTAEDQEQWVKDNFYHAPAIDALLRLTIVKENILRAVRTAMEQKLFVSQQ